MPRKTQENVQTLTREAQTCVQVASIYFKYDEVKLELFELEAFLNRLRYLATYLEYYIDDRALIGKLKYFCMQLVAHIDFIRKRPGVQKRKRINRLDIDQLLKKVSEQSKKAA
ncbi:MAG: hypothetical protein R3B60_01705 [Candidatus Paceibacterota bacterium]